MFLRKLRRGSSKYKGNIPFKCFDYGQVVHFDAKYPNKNKENQFEKY